MCLLLRLYAHIHVGVYGLWPGIIKMPQCSLPGTHHYVLQVNGIHQYPQVGGWILVHL